MWPAPAVHEADNVEMGEGMEFWSCFVNCIRTNKHLLIIVQPTSILPYLAGTLVLAPPPMTMQQ
eukprot:6909158-Prorocentrum_lima.AAC.1